VPSFFIIDPVDVSVTKGVTFMDSGGSNKSLPLSKFFVAVLFRDKVIFCDTEEWPVDSSVNFASVPFTQML